MSHPGTYFNSPTLGVAGLVTGDLDTAVEFDPASDQYAMQDDAVPQQVLSAFTVGGIIKPNDATDPHAPLWWDISGAVGVQLGIGQDIGGGVRFVFVPGGGFSGIAYFIGDTVMSNGSTYRVICTWDGALAKLYVNGVLDGGILTGGGAVPYSGTGGTAPFGPTEILAGGGDGTWNLDEDCSFVAATDVFDLVGNFSLDGTLDELFFVVNHAASGAEVTAIDDAMTGTGDVETEINNLFPYIYWRLGEASGIVVNDSAPPAATINGTVSEAFTFAPDIFVESDGVGPFDITELLYEGGGSVEGGGGGGGGAVIGLGGQIVIGTHRYFVDWKDYQRSTVSPFREARDSAALPGENSLNPLAAWKRSRDDWTLGAGQTWADRSLDNTSRGRDLEPRQFRVSKGIDPWTLGQFKLLPTTEVALEDDDVQQMVVIGEWVYVLSFDGDIIYRSNDLDGDPGSVSTDTITGLTGDPLAIATDGERLYISTTTGMFTSAISGTSASAMAGAAATYSPTLLVWMNGWLFAALNNVISEIRAGGSVNMVYTHLNDGFTWACGTGTPTFVYFGGQATDVNEIWRVGIKSDGTLGPGIFAGSLPIGEFIRAMAYYGGFVLIGSTKGIHLAAQGGDGALNLAPVIATSEPVLCMTPESRFVWFGWSEYDSDSTGLGRMDLSAFSDTQALIPAFASDLMFDGSSGAVQAVVRYQDRTLFAVTGEGIVHERYNDELVQHVDEGEIRLGRFRWGTFEPKVWLGLEVVTDPLSGDSNGVVQMDVSNETTVVTSLGFRGPDNDSTGVGAIYGVGTINASYDWFEPIVTLTPAGDDFEFSPIVRRVTMRALPVPKTIEQYAVPIRMAEDVNDEESDGGDFPYNTSDEYRYLQGLVSKGIPVIFTIHEEQHLVTVREVTWQSVHGLTTQRDGVQGIIMVTLITAEI